VQNTVERHQLGISLGAMNFLRSLLSTILVAAFGAIVLAGAGAAGAAQAFAWVFYADAACIAVALIAVVLMEERPLQEGP
jgi:Na+/melibiose symporter-like transporter